MIKGHGDDAYQYGCQAAVNFSSNVYYNVDLSGLKDHLAHHLDLIGSYPEPEPFGLEKELADRNRLLPDEVCVTNGATEAIYLIAQAFRQSVSAVLQPTFSEYADACRMHGHRLLPLYQLPDARCGYRLQEEVQLLWMCNPNNPTGALYPKEILEEIVEIARQNQLIIFSDEIYDRLVMDEEEHISIASLAPDLFCVTFSGLSKSHMIAGFRIGWMVLSGNKALAKDYIEGINMLSNMRLCSNVPAQSIVQTALWGHQSVKDYIVPGGRIYEQREFIYNALNDIPGISAVKPKAAFYIFPKIDTKKFNITNDEQFALDLLRDKKILLIHGGGFNWKEPDHFRVVYLPRIEILKDATEKLGDFLKYYKQK